MALRRDDQAAVSIQPGGRADEKELLTLIRSRPHGDPARQAACDALVARYEPIVRSCVNRYRNSPEPTEDLMQVGYVGLLNRSSRSPPSTPPPGVTTACKAWES